MIRRTIIILTAVALAFTGLTACTATTPDPRPSMPSVTTSPMAEPPQIDNPLIPVSDSIDTTNFTQPARVNGWWVGGEPYYAVITIEMSQDDWSQVATQLGFDEMVDPSQLQMSEATARSLIDVDALADEISQHFEKMGDKPLDIRSIETYYDLVVSSS